MMTNYHLFEFMDLDWLPSGLRLTLREILECGNARPFRPYYSWVADHVLSCAQKRGLKTVVELGAGTAPITRHMCKDPRSTGLQLVICDNNPDHAAYQELTTQFPGKVRAIQEPIDFSQPRLWSPETLLLLSATLHHVPSDERPAVIASLTQSADYVVVFEPLRRTVTSIIFVFLSTIPALLVPLAFLRRPGRIRRFFWCWLLPIAPIMFWWDGVMSCLRQWTEAEWRRELDEIPSRGKQASIEHSLFCQKVSW